MNGDDLIEHECKVWQHVIKQPSNGTHLVLGVMRLRPYVFLHIAVSLLIGSLPSEPQLQPDLWALAPQQLSEACFHTLHFHARR